MDNFLLFFVGTFMFFFGFIACVILYDYSEKKDIEKRCIENEKEMELERKIRRIVHSIDQEDRI